MGNIRFVALGALIVVGAGAWYLRTPAPDSWADPDFGCVMPLVQPRPILVADFEHAETYRESCGCGDAGAAATSVAEKRTLELACRLYSDETCHLRFEPFASTMDGDRTAVVVRRSTGDCGGCGAFTVAAVFEHGALKAIEPLGHYGRFGNGPDGVRWVAVAGEPALELAWSESQGGYTHEYRDVFLREGDGFKKGVCIETGWDDAGARENSSAWTATLDYAADGGIGIRYTATKQGEQRFGMYPVTLGFDRRARTWIGDQPYAGCLSPPESVH